VAHLVRETGLLHRGRRIAAADNRCASVRRCLRERLRDGASAAIEGRRFEHAHGAVPDDSPGRFDRACIRRNGSGANVEHGLVRRDRVAFHDVRRVRLLQRRSHETVVRERQAHARTVQQFARKLHAFILHERLARFQPHRLVECARHRATDEQAVHLGEQGFDDVDLSGDLGASEDGHEGAFRIGQCCAEVLQLFLHEETGDGGGQVLRDTHGGTVRAVRRAKGIVHEEVAELGERARQLRVVLLLAGVEAGVLQQQELAVA
jgi:hypothetical protein